MSSSLNSCYSYGRDPRVGMPERFQRDPRASKFHVKTKVWVITSVKAMCLYSKLCPPETQ